MSMGGTELNTNTSNAWPSGSLAIFVPFYLTTPMKVATIWWLNGATVSGNVDAGIYDASGNRIYSVGSIAQSGTQNFQVNTVPVSLILGPGVYYLALVCDNTTATIRSEFNTFVTGSYAKMLGMAQATVAFPLPKSPTLISIGQDYTPSVGISATADT